VFDALILYEANASVTFYLIQNSSGSDRGTKEIQSEPLLFRPSRSDERIARDFQRTQRLIEILLSVRNKTKMIKIKQ